MPLRNIKVLELAGLAPAPICGMILADFGANVIRVDRVGTDQMDFVANGKRSIALNLKSPKGVEVFRKLSDKCDVVIDPFRKGVMERLKLGPKDLMSTNRMLIYARLTGFGQDGPYSRMAGHDINYLSISGLLSLFGRARGKPTPPVNFAADFAGGGVPCALGIVMALYERTQSQMGQVIDASMVEGTAYVGSWIFRSQKSPLWGQPRGHNILDSGAHFYETYETLDGKFMAVGAIEPQFYKIFLEKLDLKDDDVPQFLDFEANKEKLSKIFKGKTQEEWSKIFDDTDACVTPVLSIHQLLDHPHNRFQESFAVAEDGTVAPRPSPRLSRTPGKSNYQKKSPALGENSREILLEFGFGDQKINEYISSGVVCQNLQKSKL
ncbi:alpha-methylacyl-CoA racemase [Fopius arisanus]|uniref:Alpha-methylacyl-CoA racemase n=1 Tax=Fopius arisanus TaxID=64838 RepID=A0A0C9QBA8_9HYME|nr:PREDICTED: alpha-methylacyl-CoA racemase [Fopius arisanus]XP_011309303.1 PREDICTED: alpha-methylacyl-CoA racemase [Fopius arisanus]